MGDFGLERREIAPFVDRRAAHMAVEVAIGTFRQAERPVNIDPEARVGRERPRRCVATSAMALQIIAPLCQRTAGRASGGLRRLHKASSPVSPVRTRIDPLDRKNEDLAVADLAGAGGRPDRLDVGSTSWSLTAISRRTFGM